jgi:UDP-glucuronate decarboxylase
MTILITGGAGFIGTTLCDTLLRMGNNVISVDNLSCGLISNVNMLKSKYPGLYTFIHADIVNYNFDNIINVNQIYHLACPASPKSYQADPIQTLKTNFIGTLNVLEFARKNKCRILFTSTSEVYGDPLEHPQKESYWGNVNPIGIRSCYDEGKRVAETLMFDYKRVHDTDIRVVRIFNTYGPYMAIDDGRVVSNFICQALSNKDITIYGDGSQTRSCCYVTDTVTGLISFMNQDKLIGPVNIGNPYEITITELANLVLKNIPDSQSKVIFCELPQDDPKIRKPNISLASTFWKPIINLDKGLQLTIDYFKHNFYNQKT